LRSLALNLSLAKKCFYDLCQQILEKKLLYFDPKRHKKQKDMKNKCNYLKSIEIINFPFRKDYRDNFTKGG